MTSALTKTIKELIVNTREKTVIELKDFLVSEDSKRKDDIEAMCEEFTKMTTKTVKKRAPTGWNLHVKETNEKLTAMGMPKHNLMQEASITWKLKKAELAKLEKHEKDKG